MCSSDLFFRILYQQLAEEIHSLLQGFKTSFPGTIHRQIAALLKSKAISLLGLSCIDDGLYLALNQAGILPCDHYRIYDRAVEFSENDGKPCIFWINGTISDKDTIDASLSIPANRLGDLVDDGNAFFSKISEAKAVLVIAFHPGEFGWKAIYGQLLNLAKQNKPVYWVADGDSLPLKHIGSLDSVSRIDGQPVKVLNELLEGLSQERVEEGKELEFRFPGDEAWKQRIVDRAQYLIAMLLNYGMNRFYAYRLFEEILQGYVEDRNYKMAALCYQNMGEILLEQGYLERSIESHIKAIDYWAMARDEDSMAHEYVLCADNYWNGSAPEKAMQHYGEALSFYRNLENQKGIAEVTSKLALICDADEDYELASRYYIENLKAKKKILDKRGEILGLVNLSNCLIKNQEWDRAKNYLEEGIQLSEKYHETAWLPDLYQLLGLIAMNAHDYALAREHYEKVHILYSKEKDELSLTFVYCNLGHLCARLEDFEPAIKYYEKTLEIYERMGDWQHLAAVYTNLGLLYFNQQNYEVAEEYFGRAEEIFAILRDISNLIKTHSNLAKVYLVQGQMENAVECYQANIEMLLQLGAKENLATTFVELAMVYLQSEEYKTCVEMLRKAIDIYEALGLKEEKKQTAQLLTTIESRIVSK